MKWRHFLTLLHTHLNLQRFFRPVGRGLYWEDVQNGLVSGSSCCPSVRWTSCWPARTRSHEASEARSEFHPQPENKCLLFSFKCRTIRPTGRLSETWVSLLDCQYNPEPCSTLSSLYCPPDIQSLLCCSHLSGHGWWPWTWTHQWCRQRIAHQEKTSHLAPVHTHRHTHTIFITLTLSESQIFHIYIVRPSKWFHLQHTAIICKSLQIISNTHAKLFRPTLHGTSDQEAVARLKHVKWAGDCGKGHSAHKDGHFLVQTTRDDENKNIKLVFDEK